MLAEPHCLFRGCLHLQGILQATPGDEATDVPYCTAFPEGIPSDISYGDNLHRTRDTRRENDIVFTHGPAAAEG